MAHPLIILTTNMMRTNIMRVTIDDEYDDDCGGGSGGERGVSGVEGDHTWCEW
jgi:hypothetical protein